MRFSDDDLFQGAKWRKYPLPMQIRIEQNVQPNKPVRLHIGGLIMRKYMICLKCRQGYWYTPFVDSRCPHCQASPAD